MMNVVKSDQAKQGTTSVYGQERIEMSKSVVRAGWNDVPHLTEDAKQEIFTSSGQCVTMGSHEEHGVKWTALVDSPCSKAPHVVVLGSGASAQAFPSGDANQIPIPMMPTLVKTIGLSEDLNSAGVNTTADNFEDLYSQLCSDVGSEDLRRTLEEKVYTYFAKLELPLRPTLYDLLLLSLRPKDVVATFNWDPFLFDAYERNRSRAPLPAIAHLHGNVRIGSCPSHGLPGRNGEQCPVCGKPFHPSRLLFPIAKKDYSSDPFITREWKLLRKAMGEAFALTIFGYGAPSSDVDAVELMLNAWKAVSNREINQIEVIDIKPELEVQDKWRKFFTTQHCSVVRDFNDSFIRRFPRRTCEGLFQPVAYGNFVESTPVVSPNPLEDIDDWLGPLVEAEEACNNDPDPSRHAHDEGGTWVPGSHGSLS